MNKFINCNFASVTIRTCKFTECKTTCTFRYRCDRMVKKAHVIPTNVLTLLSMRSSRLGR